MEFSKFDFSDKTVLLRVDFNVPLKEGVVSDRNRIKAAVPTIKAITEKGGKVVLMSHLGRPKGERNSAFSLSQITGAVAEELNLKVDFINDCISEKVEERVQSLASKEVLLLENLRFYSEEEMGDEEFAKALAGLGDIYINDAFGTAHRAHASTAVIANYFDDQSKGFGLLIEKELRAVEQLLSNPESPFTAIMGGAKISDKILLIENILDKVDGLIIGGGMSFTFFKAKGGKVGKSLVEEDKLDLARELTKKAAESGVKIHLPQDSIIADTFSAEAKTDEADNMEIPDGWMGLDIGPKAAEQFAEVISSSKTILWNGPMGVFELEKFSSGTKAVAKAISKATKEGAFSLIGGGDSAAAIRKFNFQDEVSYISTGGGALLEYLEGKELPGIKAISG